METTTLALAVSRTVICNAFGYALLTVGPRAAGESWIINRIAVLNNGAFKPRVNIYRGSAPLPTRFLEGTSSGNSDVSDSTIKLTSLDSISVEWVAGTPGSASTAIIEGDQILAGKRAY